MIIFGGGGGGMESRPVDRGGLQKGPFMATQNGPKIV